MAYTYNAIMMLTMSHDNIDIETLPGFAAEYMRTLQAPFSSDAKGIPSGDALLDRMYAVAMEHGIHGIQQDAVRLMFSALEVFTT